MVVIIKSILNSLDCAWYTSPHVHNTAQDGEMQSRQEFSCFNETPLTALYQIKDLWVCKMNVYFQVLKCGGKYVSQK